jgi:hypothetical protein
VYAYDRGRVGGKILHRTVSGSVACLFRRLSKQRRSTNTILEWVTLHFRANDRVECIAQGEIPTFTEVG